MTAPSFKALQAFETAARHGSFAAAADELCVSAAAVGQLVRKLEDQTGRQLFHRRGKRLELSEAGQGVLPRFSAAFRDLENAVQELQGHSVTPNLTISVPPSFATGWLSSRLSDFVAGVGQIEVFVRAEEDPVSFERSSIDIRLTFGDWHYPGFHVDKVLHDVAMPVCSAGLLEKFPEIAAPEDLLRLPLIHTQWPSAQASYPSWRNWSQEFCGSTKMQLVRRGHSANGSKLAIELARAGLGVTLAQRIYVADLIDKHQLVCPINRAIAFEVPYCLCIPYRRANNPLVQSFGTWMRDEMKKSL